MPNTHISKIFGIKQARIAKLTADPSGGAATYATSVALTAARSLGPLTQGFNPKYLKGDNTLLDMDIAQTEPWVGKLVNAKCNLDAESVLTGGTVVDSGTTPNQVTTLSQYGGTAASPSNANFFKMEAVGATMDIIGGDCHIVLYKCMITSANFLGFADEDYAMYDFDIACVPRLSDGKWYDRIYNQTAVAAA